MSPTTRSLASLGSDTLVKVLRKDRIHHGMTYTFGLNTCPQPWDYTECASGGLYICRLKDLLLWASLYPDIDTVAIVEIPDDTQRIDYVTKIKVSALVIKRFIPYMSAMELAFQNGADVHAHDNAALRWASENGHVPVVEFLLQHGAIIDDYSLLVAANNGHLPVVRVLVKHGVSVRDGNEALWKAAANGHLDVVEFLVQHGANIHFDDNKPLRIASMFGRLHIVKFLVQQGADVHAKYNYPLFAAKLYNYHDLFHFLASLP